MTATFRVTHRPEPQPLALVCTVAVAPGDGLANVTIRTDAADTDAPGRRSVADSGRIEEHTL